MPVGVTSAQVFEEFVTALADVRAVVTPHPATAQKVAETGPRAQLHRSLDLAMLSMDPAGMPALAWGVARAARPGCVGVLPLGSTVIVQRPLWKGIVGVWTEEAVQVDLVLMKQTCLAKIIAQAG